MAPDTTEVHAYYKAALAALSFLERARPTGRRFGADADARWAATRGGLTPGDRVDLLLRDANAEWSGALGARAAFDFASVAEDDAFGRDWPGLDGVTAEQFFRNAASAAPADVTGALRAMASAWGLSLTPMSARGIDPRSRFVVAGPSAIVALASAFAGSPDARWPTQVICVADRPAVRQLAAAVPALLNQPGAFVLVRSTDALPASAGTASAVVSADATPAEARRAEASPT